MTADVWWKFGIGCRWKKRKKKIAAHKCNEWTLVVYQENKLLLPRVWLQTYVYDSVEVVATMSFSVCRRSVRLLRLKIRMHAYAVRPPIYLADCRLFYVRAASKYVGNIWHLMAIYLQKWTIMNTSLVW